MKKIKRQALAMTDQVESVKGKLDASGSMNHRGGEARVEDLVLMD
jgi:hypothetical protein